MGGDRHTYINRPGVGGAIVGSVPEMSLAELRRGSDCVRLLNLDGRIVFMSEGALCAREVPDHGLVAGKIWWTLWPEEEQQKVRAAFDMAVLGEPAEFTGACPTESGQVRLWNVTVAPVIGMTGRIGKLLVTCRRHDVRVGRT